MSQLITMKPSFTYPYETMIRINSLLASLVF